LYTGAGNCFDLAYKGFKGVFGIGVSSVALNQEEQCVFFDGPNCGGYNLIVSQFQADMDVFKDNPTPGVSVQATFNDSLKSFWCCSNKGRSEERCGGSCLCDDSDITII
jgi:hypothetical protein